MRIIAIGDPHGEIDKLKNIPLKGADLILVTGDLASVNIARKMAFESIERERKNLPKKEYPKSMEKRAFMESYTSAIKVVKYLAKFAPVYTIFGNADPSSKTIRNFSKEFGVKFRSLYEELNSVKGARVINNTRATYNGIRIGGLEYFLDTNWVRDFGSKGSSKRMKKAARGTKKARKVLSYFGDLDILLCHQPPYGVLDKVSAKFAPKAWRGKHAGSETILNYIKKKQPRYVFCGHIHEGEGKGRIGKSEIFNLGVGGYKVIDYRHYSKQSQFS